MSIENGNGTYRARCVVGTQHDGPMSAIFVTGLALVGTWIQFVLSVQQVDGFEREAFRVIDDWRTEVPRRRPIRWYRHRRALREILASSPDEAAAFKRVWRLVVSWALLLSAAGIAFVVSVVSVI